MARVTNLKELFLDQVNSLLHAEHQLVKALPKMILASASVPLKDALALHLKDTEKQMDRLEQVLLDLNESPRTVKCRGIEGILDEASTMLEAVEPPARDAATAFSCQQVAHYEICAYHMLQEWAKMLGYYTAAKLIGVTLTEEKVANEALATLARGGINAAANGRESPEAANPRAG